MSDYKTTAVDRERNRIINILDTVQQKVQGKLVNKPDAEMGYQDKMHNSMVLWFSGLIDAAMARITAPMFQAYTVSESGEDYDAAGE